MRRPRRRTLILIIAVIVAGGSLGYLKVPQRGLKLDRSRVPKDFWGITFSKKYAQELGLEWREAYRAALDDLQIKRVRLPVYWDDVEQIQGTDDWSSYDWMIDEGARRGVKFILNVGRRLPRWPECHQPSWTSASSEASIDAYHEAYTKRAIEHFRPVTSIEAWQLENEYFFPWFGRCPKANMGLIEREITSLRSVDDRPLILTDSGELNTWRKAADRSDVLGVTMYRVAWNNIIGYVYYPWPSWLYPLKAFFAGKSTATTFIAELQAEPWPARYQSVTAIDATERAKTFTADSLESHAEFARRTGLSRAYFWGVEFWYWMKEHGEASVWERARLILTSPK